jgi:hypothetical protein
VQFVIVLFIDEVSTPKVPTFVKERPDTTIHLLPDKVMPFTFPVIVAASF